MESRKSRKKPPLIDCNMHTCDFRIHLASVKVELIETVTALTMTKEELAKTKANYKTETERAEK